MLRYELRQIVGIVLLLALATGLRGARPTLATPETAIARSNIVTWRGGSTDNLWSNPANWAEGALPAANDTVRFAAGAPDALLDSNAIVAGIVLAAGYQGTVTLARPLTVRGDVQVAGGTLNGGTASLTIAGKATVTGGTLTTPANLMTVSALDIEALGIVRMGPNAKLDLTGDGTPLTGAGLLDTTTHTPNSVEYTAHVTSDLTAAGPLAGYHAFGLDKAVQGLPPGGLRAPGRPSAVSGSSTLTFNPGERGVASAVIDTVNGFAYFGTWTSPGIVVKVRLSDFTRVGALTLPSGENGLGSAVIDTTHGFAYFGTITEPGIVIEVRLSDFMQVGALPLSPGEVDLFSAVIDTTHGFAYFGSDSAPGIVIKVRLSDLTRVGALTLATNEYFLYPAVIDAAHGFAYFATQYDPCACKSSIVKVDLNGVDVPKRVGVLALNYGEVVSGFSGSAVIDTVNGYAYFGIYSAPGSIVKLDLSGAVPSRVGALTLNKGENGIYGAVIDTSAGLAYFGSAVGSTGALVKINLNGVGTPTEAGTLTLGSGQVSPQAPVIDTANGFGYWATGAVTTPTVVVKVDVSRHPTMVLNYPDGKPGSAFVLTGSDFPPNATVHFTVNGIDVSPDVIDQPDASFALVMATTGGASNGWYQVVGKRFGLLNSRAAPAAIDSSQDFSATAFYHLDANAPLRDPPVNPPPTQINVPASVPAHSYSPFTFLPLVQR